MTQVLGAAVPKNAVVLPFLTEDVLSDPRAVLALTRSAAEAVAAKRPLMASTPLTPAALAGATSSRSEPADLDAGAIVARAELAFLLESACIVDVPPALAPAGYLTPIEARLAHALRRAGVQYSSQAAIGRFRVDFLIHDAGRDQHWLVVEADGVAFHDADQDAARDRELADAGYETMRFPGPRIHREAAACASEVAARLAEGPGRRRWSHQNSLKLDESQLRAANHLAGPARVAAPAGSGKTRVIDARVRRLVARGIPASRICAISFTNKAVGEMQARLADVAEDAHFTTLHSLAKQVADRAGISRQLIQGIPPGQARRHPTRWQLLRDLLDEDEYRFRGSRELWVDAVAAYRQSFTPPTFGDWEPRHRPTVERFLDVCAAFDETLRRRNLTDFEGYVHDAVRELARDPERRALEGARFDWWIVDEYQDLPVGKLKLLRLLVAPARNVFVVGDDDQVLYGFAGASPTIFGAFSAEFAGAAEYELTTNHRSAHEIVVRSAWLAERNRDRVAKTTQSAAEIGRPGVVNIARDSAYEHEALRFVQATLQRGVPADDVAVLVRLRDYAVPVERALSEAGIPHTQCSTRQFADRETVRTIVAWLTLCGCAPGDYSELVETTLKRPQRYLRKPTVETLVGAVAGGQPRSIEALASVLEDCAADIERDHQRHAVREYVATVTTAGRLAKPSDILDALDLREAFAGEAAPAAQATPAVVHDVLYRLAVQFSTVEELLAWLRSTGRDRDYDLDPQAADTCPGAVTIASVHQAKGLEWPHVAVVGPLDGMPDRRATTAAELEEERRVAYVGATRAGESLLFNCSTLYAEELEKRGDGLTWSEYVNGRTTPINRVGRGRDTRRTPGRDPNMPPDGAVKRKGVWVLREPVAGATRCVCGVALWQPPRDSACPECGSSVG